MFLNNGNTKKVLLFFCFVHLFFSLYSESLENATFWDNYPNEDLAKSITDRMSNEELFAQILMFGWAGDQPSELLLQWIRQRGLGSAKVYGWSTNDVSQVAKSVLQIQQTTDKNRFRIPMFIATDQEGGWIRHIKGKTSDTPGNLALGADGLPYDAFYSGYYIAKELRALGINMNFAPTVDIYSNYESSVIGPRSFGEDAIKTGILGAAFASGSQKAGVIATGKHFPGHGDTGIDSHGRLPQIDISKEVFYERELVPFKYLIEQDIFAIMTGHLSFPNVIGNKEPASLSRTFIQDILRRELGFTGLVITDDMMMNGAISYAGSLSKAVELAIRAGNDIVIASTTAQLSDALWTSNFQRMFWDTEFASIIKKAAYNVILKKLEYFKGTNPVPIYPDIELVDSSVPDVEGQEFFLSQACRSITLYKGNSSIENVDNKDILLVGQFDAFFEYGEKRFPNASHFKFSNYMSSANRIWYQNELKRMIRNYDTIILCVADEESAKLAEALKNEGKEIFIVSVLSPIYVFDFSWADSILLAYSYSPYSFNAVFAALSGDFIPQGDLPLTGDSNKK